MRVQFVHLDRDPVRWSGEQALRIGSDADNTLTLPGRGVAAHHVTIVRDRRGLVLEVERGAPRVYVNARPVRERALLRLGDMLGIGAHGCRLCADEIGAVGMSTDAGRPASVGLRVVAGSLSGRVLRVRGRLDLDANGRITAAGAGVVCIDCDAGYPSLVATTTVSVNGIEADKACLRDGDQLVLGAHRFVVEAAVGPVVTVTASGDDDSGASPPAHAGTRRQMGWLVATAAILALALALLLFVRF